MRYGSNVIQDLATAHWQGTARAEDRDAYIWVVVRHEIDYRGNIAAGDSVTGETFIPGLPSGAKFDRRVNFTDAAGQVIVSANTTWAMIDRGSGRPCAGARGDRRAVPDRLNLRELP